MPTSAQNLTYVQAGLEELENYLLSDNLYWPLDGDNSLQRLTIGGLLLGLIRIQAEQQGGGQSTQADRLVNRLDVVRTKWKAAWEKKCRSEIHTRLTLWKNYLLDYRQSPELEAEMYPQQVQWRVYLQLLIKETDYQPEEIKQLTNLDAMVKSAWLPGSFIWEPNLATALPEPEYWFLYGRLKS